MAALAVGSGAAAVTYTIENLDVYKRQVQKCVIYKQHLEQSFWICLLYKTYLEQRCGQKKKHIVESLVEFQDMAASILNKKELYQRIRSTVSSAVPDSYARIFEKRDDHFVECTADGDRVLDIEEEARLRSFCGTGGIQMCIRDRSERALQGEALADCIRAKGIPAEAYQNLADVLPDFSKSSAEKTVAFEMCIRDRSVSL